MPGCCPSKPRGPGVRTMASDLAATVVQAIRHAVQTGELIASDHIIRSRIDTCNKCDQKSGVRCLACGCFISMKAAVLVAECPKSKWASL
jgi:hypothetical protein